MRPKSFKNLFITPTTLLRPYFAYGIVSMDVMFSDYHSDFTVKVHPLVLSRQAELNRDD